MQVRAVDGMREPINLGSALTFSVSYNDRDNDGTYVLRIRGFAEGWTRYVISAEDYRRIVEEPEYAHLFPQHQAPPLEQYGPTTTHRPTRNPDGSYWFQ